MSEATAKAVGKRLKSSPRKLNALTALIRGLSVQRAVDDLRFSRKRASGDVLKVLESAVANAENNHGLDVDALMVREAYVSKALTLKRMRPRARGRGMQILKRYGSVTVVLSQREGEGEDLLWDRK